MSIVSYLRLTPKEEFVTQFRKELDELLVTVREHKGFIGVEVLQPIGNSGEYIIVSEWEKQEDFKAYEHSARHAEIKAEYNLRTGDGYTKMRLDRYR